MRSFLRELLGEWTTGTASQKLAIAANLLSILGVSVVALFSASALQFLVVGKIDWAGAALVAAIVFGAMGIVIAIQDLLLVFRAAIDARSVRRLITFVVVAWWFLAIGIGLSLVPAMVEALVFGGTAS